MTPPCALHPEAFGDVDELVAHGGQGNPAVAIRLLDEIHRALEGLTPFPHQGHRRPDLTARPIRSIVVRDYLIAYAPNEKPLWVIAVLHGRRDPRTMAAILRGREGLGS